MVNDRSRVGLVDSPAAGPLAVEGGASGDAAAPGRPCLPKEKARPARDLNEGGGGSGSWSRAPASLGMGAVAVTGLRENSGSWSASRSRSWSMEEGRVEEELWRAEAEDDS